MATKKKKSKKQDPKLVAKKQKYEIEHIHAKFGIPKERVTYAVMEVGPSRAKVYSLLRDMGYTIITRGTGKSKK